MAILVAFPFGFSSIAFGLESSLEQGLCACNCLPALVGQNRSSDWVLPIPTALQSSNIYHTPCLSPLENDISQCNFAPLIPHPQLPSLPPWVLTFPRMGSPFFFFSSYFVYLWEVAQVRHSKWNQVTLPSALHLKIPDCFFFMSREQTQITSPPAALSTLWSKAPRATLL